ncbi:hypothetical protein ABL840_12165 [Variovorax sp. NFACC27]|uniref:hypothetical protein n=1 Tax=unclassified Variovorax TaxID=663243 RepID=UPI00089BD6E1|nr:hypothetical protein SAMN03159371_01773 [Variovorax sp. NFACC28]SEG31526.1 hypothetical protein SAMN03159365_01854 [Variovorax sp. NFACC29]SFC40302.1 hypothetical protein SAMN03159379_02147 [Variovorax sp. NFACC26]SFF90017.1 hypothetical protein SAMN03159447_00723 [Variovorax sp. NFACC27]
MSGREFCAPDNANYPKWTSWDAFKWQMLPQRLGGGFPHLSDYKDAWVLYNRLRIVAVAKKYQISPVLLGSVAWAEVGGKPDGSKRPMFALRSFDWSGPDWVDRNLTITKPPGQTSFGAVSIQMRAATRELGLDPDSLSYEEELKLVSCLEQDLFNLEIVARHLQGLVLHDYPGADTENLSEEQFVVAGARYNRGIERQLSDIVDSLKATPGSSGREYSSYGRAMVKHREHVESLLGR